MNRLSALARGLVGAGMAAGLAGQVLAAPVFTVNPGAIGSGPAAPFQADQIAVIGSSELLTTTIGAVAPGTLATGTGWAEFGSFSNGATQVFSFTSGVNNVPGYGLFMTYSIQTSLLTGAMGAPSSTYAVTDLTYQLWEKTLPDGTAATNYINGFVNANATSATNATAPTAGADLLGYGALVLAPNSASITAGGGVGITAFDSLFLCNGAGTSTASGHTFNTGPATACTDGIGSNYFALPVPFYQLAFSSFINNSQAASNNGTNLLAIVGATGNVTFNNVPEPESLALVGLALLGAGAATLRKRNAAR